MNEFNPIVGNMISKGKKSKHPFITVNRKSKRIFFNKKSIELLEIESGDIMSFGFDNSKEKLFVKKVDSEENGNRVYKFGNSAMAFSNEALMDLITEFFGYYEITPKFRLKMVRTGEKGVYRLDDMTPASKWKKK